MAAVLPIVFSIDEEKKKSGFRAPLYHFGCYTRDIFLHGVFTSALRRRVHLRKAWHLLVGLPRTGSQTRNEGIPRRYLARRFPTHHYCHGVPCLERLSPASTVRDSSPRIVTSIGTSLFRRFDAVPLPEARSLVIGSIEEREMSQLRAVSASIAALYGHQRP